MGNLPQWDLCEEQERPEQNLHGGVGPDARPREQSGRRARAPASCEALSSNPRSAEKGREEGDREEWRKEEEFRRGEEREEERRRKGWKEGEKGSLWTFPQGPGRGKGGKDTTQVTGPTAWHRCDNGWIPHRFEISAIRIGEHALSGRSGLHV